MHVAQPLRRHDRRRAPARPPRPIAIRTAHDDALDRQSAGMNAVALQILTGFLGTLLLIQLYAWATGAPGVAVMLGGL